MSATYVYLYCLLAAGPAPETAGLRGLEDQPVTIRQSGPLLAVISRVGAAFGADALNERIRDLEWLSTRALRHHQVIDHIYERQPQLLPLTFGAIFASEDRLDERLQAGQASLLESLERLRGRQEWDLKLLRDEAAFNAGLTDASPELQRLEAEAQAQSPGRAFMLRKKLESLRAEEARRIRTGVRSTMHRRLAALAAEAHEDPIVAPTDAGSQELILRSAYLVDDGRVADLQAEAQRLALETGPLGFTLELTGPWPAYSFAGRLPAVAP